jgi:hypothetical protein
MVGAVWHLPTVAKQERTVATVLVQEAPRASRERLWSVEVDGAILGTIRRPKPQRGSRFAFSAYVIRFKGEGDDHVGNFWTRPEAVRAIKENA